MENKYIIMSRYEYWTSEGKKFTDWFVLDSKPITKNEANEVIKKHKDNFKFIDQKTKLTHEYLLKDYNEYQNEYKEYIKNVNKLLKKQEEYFKSDKYKELCKKKRESAKELKEKQKQYKKEHSN